MNRVALLAATSLLCAGAVYGADTMPTEQPSLEKAFDAQISRAEMGGWLKRLAAEPNQVGSPHDKANAEWVLAQFKSWGWDAHMETFDVLYPTPIHESLELLGGKKPFKATLQERPIPGDSSATAKDYALPAYFAYQGDGDVTAPVVYVNYGMPDDYEALQKMGVSVRGKIVIARYGAGWRGLKPKLAQEHGAVGCIVYSDPHDDGYAVDSTYPDGPARPPQGIQRGSVQDMTLYPGDPLTPGIGATKDAKRLPISEAKTILKIPALPISYADAQVFLKALGGQVVPASWRGSLPITYRVGPSTVSAHLVVKSDWSLKTLYDVVAVMHGSTYPDQWVLRGNHRDGWVFGATDPLSGQISLLAEAKALGGLAAKGWRPKRTIVYLSWDGEEPGLLGSTEWAETHADELKKKAVLYLNSDSNSRGIFGAEGSHDLEHLITGVIDEVTDPETNVSVGERYRAKLRAEAVEPGMRDRDHARAIAKIAADPSRDAPIEALGSGSDYSAYIEHLGLAAINLGYGGEGESGGVYHSRYDTYEHHSRFVDPGFVYDALLAKTAGRIVIRTADTDLPVQRAGDFADTVSMYLSEVKKLANDKRDAQVAQAGLLRDHVYRLAADPTKSSGTPTALEPVPQFDFGPMDQAVEKLKASAKAYDDALAKNGAGLSPDRLAKLQALMLDIDQTLAPDVGLPGRPWFRNVIYAPGTLTGYGAKTLPAIREGIEQQRFADAQAYIKITADALNAYSARLEHATAVLNGGSAS
ncbi:MAG TPA: transferrin receptor-like dimerization domain-containing protein [Rhizomicrobium sp.]|nr:transferrin receptor-like dimerization domain-containing protein [Rhizomicrobium sp.]